MKGYIKLEGPWEQVKGKLSNLSRDIKKAITEEQRNLGRRMVRTIVNHIQNGDLALAPKKHPHKSGDPRILIDTEAYINAISTWQKNMISYMGVKRGITNGEGVEISFYAYLLEYGTADKSQVERPHWRPLVDEYGGPRGIRDTLAQGFKKKLGSEYSRLFIVN